MVSVSICLDFVVFFLSIAALVVLYRFDSWFVNPKIMAETKPAFELSSIPFERKKLAQDNV